MVKTHKLLYTQASMMIEIATTPEILHITGWPLKTNNYDEIYADLTMFNDKLGKYVNFRFIASKYFSDKRLTLVSVNINNTQYYKLSRKKVFQIYFDRHTEMTYEKLAVDKNLTAILNYLKDMV